MIMLLPSKRVLALALGMIFLAINLGARSTYRVTIDELESAFHQDNIEKLEHLLDGFNPVGETEKSAYLYYRAQIGITKDVIERNFLKIIKKHPDTHYAQECLLKMARIAILERNYQQAKDYLLKVSPDIIDRELMLASVYLQLGQFNQATSSAYSFINTSDDQKSVETAYMYIVEAHIRSREYDKAMELLQEMRQKNYTKYTGALITFKQGYCLEMKDEIVAAVSKYQNVLTHYPYTDQSYQAEKRLFDLTIADRIDTSELTTPLPSLPLSTSQRSQENSQIQKEHFYAQVNAFSVMDNARNHSIHLERSGFNNIVIPRIVDGREFYAVAVGPFESRSEVVLTQRKLKEQLDLNSFIIKHEE